MRFVLSLKVPRTKVEDKAKNIKELTLADAQLCGSKTLCEYLSCDRPCTKPYFDTESYHDAQPTEEAIQAILERSLVSVDRVMEDQTGYARCNVRVGSRHGIDPKHGKFKVSFRMWVMGFKVEYPELGRLIELKGVGGDGEGQLDLSVYKRPEQLVNCMGCCKGSLTVKGAKKVDERVLMPLEAGLPWSTYLVQHLQGDERPMTCPKAVPAPVKLKAVRKPRVVRESGAVEAAAVASVAEQMREVPISEEDDEVVKLLKLLRKERWVVRQDWRSLAIMLRNIGDDLYKESWLEFSERVGGSVGDASNPGPFLSREQESREWDDCLNPAFGGRELGIGTLKAWAKADDPEGYQYLVGQSMSELIGQAIERDGSDTSLAEVCLELFDGRYINAGDKEIALWSFDGYWRSDGWSRMISDIRTFIPVLQVEVSRLRDELAALGEGTDPKEKSQRAGVEKRLKATLKVLSRVESQTQKAQIVREMCTFISEPLFVSTLDQHGHLLNFEDGVYDLDIGEWRDGRPEDRISLSCGYKLRHVAPDEAVQLEILAFISAAFENAGVADSKLLFNAATLHGGINLKKFAINTGNGNNGKTKQADLHAAALGAYSTVLPSICLTQRVGARKPFPELMDCRGMRDVNVAEPEPGDKILPGNLKLLTGGDPIKCRQLSQKCETWVPQYTLSCSCNEDMPQIEDKNTAGADGGIMLRMLVFPHVMKFTERPREGRLERRIDLTIGKKIASEPWRQQYMLILMRIFAEKVKGGQAVSFAPEVELATAEYKADMDVVQRFVDDYIVRTDRPEDTLKAGEIYVEYRSSLADRENAVKDKPFYRKLKAVLSDYHNGLRGRDVAYVGVRFRPLAYEVEA